LPHFCYQDEAAMASIAAEHFLASRKKQRK
jgi:hypothetical protein